MTGTQAFSLANRTLKRVYSSHTIGESMEKVRPFVRVPLDVALNVDLEHSELAFAVRFLSLWWKRGEPIALDYSIREFADELGLQKNWVERQMKRLIEKGMIERMKGKGNRSAYSPTEKLTGKTSMYIMSSCGFDPAALKTYAKLKKLSDFDSWLPFFSKSAERHNVSTDEACKVVDSIAKSSRPITNRSGYIERSFRNIVAQRSGVQSQGVPSSSSSSQSSPRRRSGASSDTEALIALAKQLNNDYPVTTETLPRSLLNQWDENEYVRYDAGRDCFLKRSEAVFFYVTTSDGAIRAGRMADLDAIQTKPFVVIPGLHAPA